MIAGDPVGKAAFRGVGAGLGMWLGGALGTLVGPGIGTFIGGALGGAAGAELGGLLCDTIFKENNRHNQQRYKGAKKVVKSNHWILQSKDL